MATAQTSIPRYERAIVIGASMGGLAVARALSDHFREIVVIERDTLSLERAEHRPGVAQSWHIHGLTIGGQRALEELFPGFVDQAISLGAMRVDDRADYAIYTKYGWSTRAESEFVCLSATRILLEFAERKRFFALMKNVRYLSNTRVMDLIFDKTGSRPRVTGVITNRSDEQRISADLVVDCSGRSYGWKTWFNAHNIPLPKETLVDSRCAYSSRFYRPRNPGDLSWKGMTVEPVYPDRPHWGVIIPLENNDWVVTLGGFDGNYPPSDERGFLEFARNLPTPEYIRAIERADPLTKVRSFRKLEMRWNHFESYDRVSRFMAIGDSAWAYNPLYGQGMSVVANCARILRDVINKNNDLDSLPRRYYPTARKFALPLWSSTAQLDLRWPGAIGKRPWHGALSLPAAELAVRAASKDHVVAAAALHVAHMIKPVSEAITPGVLARIASYAVQELFAGPPELQTTMQPPPAGRTLPSSNVVATCCACAEKPCACTAPRLTA
jgi:2-polyprenyl-6-methoxyphenol hydroxylase-like FAD-dependent oxidoreductase